MIDRPGRREAGRVNAGIEVLSGPLPLALGGEGVMQFTGGLILLAVSAALLFFGRGRGGDALPIFQNWLAATMFSVAILILFVGGLMGVLL
jgi:hypothetical protein